MANSSSASTARKQLENLKAIVTNPDLDYWGKWDVVQGGIAYWEDDSDGGFWVPIEGLALLQGLFAQYIAAVNPDMIYGMITQIESLEKEVRELRRNLQSAADKSYLDGVRDGMTAERVKHTLEAAT